MLSLNHFGCIYTSCSSRHSMVNWLGSSIFPCSFCQSSQSKCFPPLLSLFSSPLKKCILPSPNIFLLFPLRFSSPAQKYIFLLQMISAFFFSVFRLPHKNILFQVLSSLCYDSRKIIEPIVTTEYWHFASYIRAGRSWFPVLEAFCKDVFVRDFPFVQPEGPARWER